MLPDNEFYDPKNLAVRQCGKSCCDNLVLVVHLPTGLWSYGYDVKNACEIIHRQARYRESMQK